MTTAIEAVWNQVKGGRMKAEELSNWYVTYMHLIVAGPFETEREARGWLTKEVRSSPNEDNEWSEHKVQQVREDRIEDFEDGERYFHD